MCDHSPVPCNKRSKEIIKGSSEKTWKWIREQEKPERYFYYSPHMHLLAYINHLSKPKEGEDWVYKTKTNKKGNVIDFLRKAKREQALQGVIGYFLSHTGTLRKEEGKFHSVRWFGSCSYNKFGTTFEEMEVRGKRVGEEGLRCKICGKGLKPFWEWVKESYGDIYRDIMINNVLDPPRYWDEVMSAVEKEDPPPDAEEYLI